MAEFHVHVEVIIHTEDGQPAPTLLEAASGLVMGLEAAMSVPLDEDGVPSEESGKPSTQQAGNAPLANLGLEITAGSPDHTTTADITIQTHEVYPGTDDIKGPGSTGEQKSGDAEW